MEQIPGREDLLDVLQMKCHVILNHFGRTRSSGLPQMLPPDNGTSQPQIFPPDQWGIFEQFRYIPVPVKIAVQANIQGDFQVAWTPYT